MVGLSLSGHLLKIYTVVWSLYLVVEIETLARGYLAIYIVIFFCVRDLKRRLLAGNPEQFLDWMRTFLDW